MSKKAMLMDIWMKKKQGNVQESHVNGHWMIKKQGNVQESHVNGHWMIKKQGNVQESHVKGHFDEEETRKCPRKPC
jgi:hypothetical protein